MQQRCIVKEIDPQLAGVVFVEVPGIYPCGAPLPKRMARLIEPAALALDAAYREIAAAGGRLFVSDMFRSSQDQARAHQDYLTGKKSAYSPPPGGSMHEAARAIDIDVGNTVIGLPRAKEILKKHGWTGIAATGSECWHHDWRGPDGQAAYDRGGKGMSRYRAMARHCIAKIGNGLAIAQQADADKKIEWIQKTLNDLVGAGLDIDGIYGEATRAAVVKYQKRCGLAPDGVAGPQTERALRLGTGGY